MASGVWPEPGGGWGLEVVAKRLEKAELSARVSQMTMEIAVALEEVQAKPGQIQVSIGFTRSR